MVTMCVPVWVGGNEDEREREGEGEGEGNKERENERERESMIQRVEVAPAVKALNVPE